MKNFEKALRDLPKPDIRVEGFKQGLRAELSRTLRRQEERRHPRRFGLAVVAASMMAILLALFVLLPEIPVRLHAALGGAAGTARPVLPLAEPMSSPALSQQVQALLHNASATADVDRSAVDDWYQQHALPVGAGELEQEQIFSVRQFRLTNGERILVFSELGSDSANPSLKF